MVRLYINHIDSQDNSHRSRVKMTIASLDPGPGVAALQAWGGQMAAYGAANQTVVDKVPPELLHMVDPYWYTSFVLRNIVIFQNGSVQKMVLYFLAMEDFLAYKLFVDTSLFQQTSVVAFRFSSK
jgi:hypothetical protein